MARFEKKPLHKFSRVKSDLAELQRWWPVHIKDDGVLGISIDPVLYRTRWSANYDISDDESVQGGIRVEAIQDDGTDVSGTEPTIVISGSGTFDALCTINHADGTSSKIRLVAPTCAADTGSGTSMPYTANDGTTTSGNRAAFNANGGHKEYHGGPYPIFMTIQELAETLDTYRHIGAINDAQKLSWLPQKTWDAVHSSPSAQVQNVLIDKDPRIAADATGYTAFPHPAPYRATVFMPMMLDNNQFSKDISNAKTLYAGLQWNKNGITRYDSDPEGADSAVIEYKKVGNSGDHLLNYNIGSAADIGNSYAHATTQPLEAKWTSQDSSDCPPPKYRMAMALAAFLKDGTYKLNNGVMIPYVYDGARTVGGVNSDTLYSTWNKAGNAEQAGDDTADLSPASIYPYFDFVQGPISPRAQGTNWTNAVLSDHTQANRPLRYELPPNTRKNWIEKIAVVETNLNTAGTGLTAYKRQLQIETDAPASTTTTPHGATPFEIGDAVFLSGMDGTLGTGRTMTIEDGITWGSRYDGRRDDATTGDKTTNTKDCNGWWIVSNVELNTPSANKIRYSFNVRNLKVTAQYTLGAGATIQQGRLGGPEVGNNTTFYECRDGADPSVATDSTAYLEDMGGMGKLNPPNALNSYQEITSFETGYKIGTGFQCGMNQGDNNVPPSSSKNDTWPSRPTIGEASQITNTGEYIGDRPVPRSIAIQTLGIPMPELIPTSPAQVATGNGSLRIPAPIGHDLCVRYNATGINGKIPITTDHIALRLEKTLWRVRQDVIPSTYNNQETIGGHNRWAWRGVSSPLWSMVDGNTGRHAWDYIKPPTWTYGRNRCWPAHERMGTRLSMSPSLIPNATGWLAAPSVHHVEPATETTKIGLSEIGCSPIYLDMQMTAFIPKRDNRMTIIEFDMNDADEKYGRHHMIYSSNQRSMGFGFSPMWNGAGTVGQYFENKFEQVDGTVVEVSQGNWISKLQSVIKSDFATPVAGGFGPSWASFSIDSARSRPTYQGSPTSNGPQAPYPANFTANRPAVWFCGAATAWTETGWQNSDTFTLPSTAGFGRMGTGFGMGDGFTYDEGFNTVRAVFTSTGMTCIFNGETIGTDNSALEPVWGFQIKACNVFGMADRDPFWIGSSDTIPATVNSISVGYPVYTHLNEEPRVMVQVNQDIYVDYDNSGNPVDVAFSPTTRQQHLESTDGSWSGTSYFHPTSTPFSALKQLDSGGRMTRADNPAYQTSTTDLQVDEIILRQIPTPAMLPFTVDTLKQQAPSVASGLARYTSLLIEADNINVSNGMRVTVSLLEPPSGTGIAKEASTVIDGFDDLDPDFIGGVGEIDLRGLPTTAVVNGFVIRFNFYIPSSEQGELHPIDWSATPIIRKYNILFDHKPTAQNTVIGNTYNGTTASTVGQTTIQTFTTKVGHIVSFRLQGNTTDIDRKITALKVDLGDGTITDFMPVTTPASAVTLDISHVYSSRPAGGTYDIKVYAQDDSENESDYILIPNAFLRVTIVAAEPVAVVRAVPSMVRAGQAIRFDGSDSYAIDTTASLTNYAWTFGDGSTGVNGATSHQDHTYATAGEYMATLIVTDSAPRNTRRSSKPIDQTIVVLTHENSVDNSNTNS